MVSVATAPDSPPEVQVPNGRPSRLNRAIYLRYSPSVGAALDRLVEHYSEVRGPINRSDIVRELILEADRDLTRRQSRKNAG